MDKKKEEKKKKLYSAPLGKKDDYNHNIPVFLDFPYLIASNQFEIVVSLDDFFYWLPNDVIILFFF